MYNIHVFRWNYSVHIYRGNEWNMRLPLEVDPKSKDAAFLDSYAMERWECVLHYMVGSQQQEAISQDAVRILLHAGLMKK